jgi:hypothetical protein
MPKNIHQDDEVWTNKTAKPGQIKKARLVCDGEAPKIKCEWVYEVQE